ncbi:putative PEP-binding protein [Streptomyces avidinii]|uniref:putative PEP-binding protein n=1 Tax=Streptomyces avidinii TaxID=1895 RepID=UPI0037AABB07
MFDRFDACNLDPSVKLFKGVVGTPGFAVAPVLQYRPGMNVPGGGEMGWPKCILIADDLTPADTANLDSQSIAGFCTARGGPISHVVQVAYGLGLPTIVAGGSDLLDIPDGTVCALDGGAGILYTDMQGDDLATALSFQPPSVEASDGALTAPERDGVAPGMPTVMGTVLQTRQIPDVLAEGASGVGLLATELFFLGKEKEFLEEEKQYSLYMEVAVALKGNPIVLRTLDIGGDKEIASLGIEPEDNSFLGVRGIRLTLRRSDLFVPHLRAIYRAARDSQGQFKIMFPMISTVEEFQRAAQLSEEIRTELGAPKVPLGVMVEVPSAALVADHFAEHVDFFSIGTNDLTQYVLAMGRTNTDLAADIDPLHPAVSRTVRLVTEAAEAAGKPVSACGGLAADPTGAVVLAALGATSITVAAPMIRSVRRFLASVPSGALHAIRQEALNVGGFPHMREFVRDVVG